MKHFNLTDFRDRYPIPEDTAKAILRNCLKDLPAQISGLKQCIKAQKRDEIVSAAHKILGVCFTISAEFMIETAQEIEMTAGCIGFDDLSKNCQRLEKELKLAFKELELYINS